MRVGIDGQALQGRRTGVGRYVFELCQELDKFLPEAVFYVYSRGPVELPVSSPRWILRTDANPLAKYAKPWLKWRGKALCGEDNLDIFWGCTSFLPYLPAKVKTVLTVYDLNYKIVPETMNFFALWIFRLFFKQDVHKAGRIVAISQGTSERLKALAGRGADIIVTPAISHDFRIQDESQVRHCLQKYNIQAPYLLAVATWEPRKNLEMLVTTFIELKKDGRLPDHKLVLAGGKGWKDGRLVELMSRGNLADIMPLGYVEDEDLPALYAGAELFVFPSIYEGFGIPVLEARACGTQVVTTDIPELHEAGGEGTVYTAPTKAGLYAGILNAIQSTRSVIDKTSHASWADGAAALAKMFREECRK